MNFTYLVLLQKQNSAIVILFKLQVLFVDTRLSGLPNA